MYVKGSATRTVAYSHPTQQNQNPQSLTTHMPSRLDSPEEVERARNILTAALGVQLNLLCGFFPVSGWLLLQRRDGEVNILGAQGAWNPEANVDALGQLMQDGWATHKGLPGFQYRALDR